MSEKVDRTGKIPEKFDDNLVLFLCRGSDRKKVSFQKREAVPKFKHKVLYVNLIYFSYIKNDINYIYLRWTLLRYLRYSSEEKRKLIRIRSRNSGRRALPCKLPLVPRVRSVVLLVVRSFVCSSVRAFVRSFVCSFVRSFGRSVGRSVGLSFVRSFIRSVGR